MTLFCDLRSLLASLPYWLSYHEQKRTRSLKTTSRVYIGNSCYLFTSAPVTARWNAVARNIFSCECEQGAPSPVWTGPISGGFTPRKSPVYTQRKDAANKCWMFHFTLDTTSKTLWHAAFLHFEWQHCFLWGYLYLGAARKLTLIAWNVNTGKTLQLQKNTGMHTLVFCMLKHCNLLFVAQMRCLCVYAQCEKA